MRVFVSIGIPDEVKQEIGRCQDELRAIPAPVRWAPIETQHLTLKFLGDVEPGRIEAIRTVLRDVAAATAPVPVRLEGVGAFPSLRRPRVFWMGVSDPDDRLKALASTIETRLASVGFPAERKQWHPHVTLGRVRGAHGLKELIDYITIGPKRCAGGGFVAAGLTLYRSTLKPDGAVHTPLEQIRFQTRN